jgi:hypothetical protein
MHMLPLSSALNSMDRILIIESNIDKLNQIYFPYNILPFFCILLYHNRRIIPCFKPISIHKNVTSQYHQNTIFFLNLHLTYSLDGNNEI